MEPELEPVCALRASAKLAKEPPLKSVDNVDGTALGQQSVNEVRTYKACATRGRLPS